MEPGEAGMPRKRDARKVQVLLRFQGQEQWQILDVLLAREVARTGLMEAARSCGISHPSMSLLVRGMGSPSVDTLGRIIEWLYLPPITGLMVIHP